MEKELSNALSDFMTSMAKECGESDKTFFVLEYLRLINQENSWKAEFLEEIYSCRVLGWAWGHSDRSVESVEERIRGHCTKFMSYEPSGKVIDFVSSEGMDYLQKVSPDIIESYQLHVYRMLELNGRGVTNHDGQGYRDYIEEELFTLVNESLREKELALQFILEEMEGASAGNKVAKDFVQRNGFVKAEYAEAMANSCIEIDGPNGPQQVLTQSIQSLPCDIDLKVRIRINVVQRVIDYWTSDNESVDLDDFL